MLKFLKNKHIQSLRNHFSFVLCFSIYIFSRRVSLKTHNSAHRTKFSTLHTKILVKNELLTRYLFLRFWFMIKEVKLMEELILTKVNKN